MPDAIVDAAKRALKKSGKLTLDPAAYTAGYVEGIKAAKAVVLEALEKYGEEKK